MSKYIMAWDAGTSSSRCILFNKAGKIVSLAQKECPPFYPQPGWVEQNPKEIWSSQVGVAMEAMAKINASYRDIAAIGITNQRETTFVWDKKTGEPVYNAIVWQCRRTAKMTESLQEEGYEPMVEEKTGLKLDPYFSASKIRWILDHIEDGQKRAESGDLLFGTVDTWLIWKLTQGKVHVTDYSNASRTMLFNIRTLSWDDDLCKLFSIPKCILPEVKASSHIYGEAHLDGGLIPIAGAGGDQQCALFGQACFEAGDAKNTYGTGAFLLMNTGESLVQSKHGLVTTIAWGLDQKITYALEGSIFVAGSSIQWLRDQLRIIDSAEDSAYMATRVDDTAGVYVVPAFTGLGAPYWDPFARGLIIGITRGTNKYHVIRATLEAQAYMSNDVLQAMAKDLGKGIHSLKVDGGASANNFLMQFQADITQTEVIRPKELETTARGAAFLAGLAVDYWKDQKEIKDIWEEDRRFFVEKSKEEVTKGIQIWKEAVKRSLQWSNDLDLRK